MLGYRTLFEVDDGQDAGDRVREQWHTWMRDKGYDADAVRSGAWARIGTSAHAIWLDRRTQDGSHAFRARLEERSEDSTWTSQLTTLVRGSGSALVWLDINNPEVAEEQQSLRPQQWTGTPRIARHLVEVMQARDGRAHLDGWPRRLSGEDARELVDILRDDRRRGPVYVAGTVGGLPVQRWLDMVSKLLRETVGIGAAYVLDEEATRIFREEAGESHCVAGGTVRTFLPRVQFGDPDDAIKHRVLSTKRIVEDPEKRLRRILGWRARDLAVDAPLPKEAVRLDQHFEGMIDALLVGDGQSAEPSAAKEKPAARSGIPAQVPPVRSETGEQDEAVRALCRSLGVESLTSERAGEVLRLVRLGEAKEENRKVVHQHISTLRETNDELHRQLERVKTELEHELLEHAVDHEELLKANAQTRHLREELKAAQQYEAAWSQPAPEEFAYPESFDAVLERFKELDFVTFTGAVHRALELDEKDQLGTWARKTWDVLLALDDYGRAKSSGECRADVGSYLCEPPSGAYRTVSANRHAPRESKDVQSNAKFREARFFSVPLEVDPDGKAFMGAHFKIAQYGTISPRLHYLDRTGQDGLVYVGYIGRHLRTKQTN